MRKRSKLFPLAAAFAVLTLVTTVLVYRRAEAAGEALGDSKEYVVPTATKVVLSAPGRYEVVLLAHVSANENVDKPRIEDLRHLRPTLVGPAADAAAWTEAEGLGSYDENNKPMLLTLGAFDVQTAGPYLLSLQYPERDGPPAKILFGKDVRARADAAARWAFAILLSVFLGGCLTVGSLLMGVVLGANVEKNGPPLS